MFHFIGIDVSKSTLQVYIPIKEENISINNSQRTIKQLYAKLKKYYKQESDKLVFVFEPTGPYSSVLKHFCIQKNILAYMVNPRQSANFAKALDNRSKTDIIDAKMLYRFHVMAEPDDIAVPVNNALQEALAEMLSYYKLLQKQRNGFSNHLEALEAKESSSFIAKQLKREIARLKKQEVEIIQDMLRLVCSDADLRQRFECIKSIKGIGDIAAIALLHLFMTYPHANRQQLTALSGLDAIEITSGSSVQRRSRISKKGNAVYRSMLFMPVLCATRHNPYMKAFYERLKENGKHSTAAQIAVMRKLMLIAHTLYSTHQMFNNELYEKRISWKQQKNENAA